MLRHTPYSPLKAIALIVFSLQFFNCRAQLSDSLYNALPFNIRPQNKATLTTIEKQQILSSVDSFKSVLFRNELNSISTSLKKEIKNTNNPKHTIDALNALAIYFNSFSIDSSIYYNNLLLVHTGTNPAYRHIASSACLAEATMYNYIDKFDSAMGYLHKCILLEEGSKDSLFLSSVYNTYCILYARLLIFDKSIEYGEKMLQLYPLNRHDDIEFKRNFLVQEGHYVGYYKQTRLPMYRDSAVALGRKALKMFKNEAAYWYLACYHNLGMLEYLDGNYSHAITLFDSSLLPQYNQVSRYYANNYFHSYLYKGICLLRLGRYTEGKKILAVIRLGSHNYGPKRDMYEALYQAAEAVGDTKTALLNYKQFKIYADSLDIIGQQGKVFETEQKYLVAQKEAAVQHLENDNLKKEEDKQHIIFISAMAGIGLLALLALVYAAYKRVQLRRIRERKQLEGQLDKMETDMQMAALQNNAAIETAMAAQRKNISQNMHDELSSSLAALLYLITDFKDAAEKNGAVPASVLADVQDEIRTLYQQSRNFMHALKNSNLPDTYNVVYLLRNLAKRFDKNSGLHIIVRADEEDIEHYFTPQQHEETYRIIKEAVANCMKHSGATEIRIHLLYEKPLFYLDIKDNGRGIQNKAKDGSDTGMGMAAISQRMEALGGKIEVTSKPDGLQLKGWFRAGSRL